jgi:hypothetical protein
MAVGTNDSTEHGRRNIVGVSLEFRGELDHPGAHVRVVECRTGRLAQTEGGSTDAHCPAETKSATHRDVTAHPYFTRATRPSVRDRGRVMFVCAPRALGHLTVDATNLGVQRNRHPDRVESRSEVRRTAGDANGGH